MVTGFTHASHCVTQPIYSTVTKNYYAHTHLHVGLLWVSDCVNETYHLIFKNFQEYISNFPDFSRIKKSQSFLGFPEL